MESEGTLKNIPSDGAKNGPHTTRPSHGRTSGPTRRSTKGQWTAEEDDVLKMAVQRFKGKNWKKIAECFKDRTDVQCLHRWQKVLNPDLVKGPWSKEEDEVIIELVSKYGAKKWSTIAQHLPGRIGKQCRERWHNHLNPNINKEAWTQDEELTLIRAHQIYGNKWAELTKFLPGRSDNAIKNHWNSSVKKKLDMYLASGLLSQFECVPLISHPNQSAASSSSKAQQSSEADSIVRGAEFEEASECSQGSTIACLSQSTNNANPRPKEQCRITEESSSVPSSEDYYPAFEEATFIISQDQCKMEDEYLEHDNSFDFAQKVWQTDPHLLPDMSLLDLGQESSDLFLPLLTDQDNREAVPFSLQSSTAFNSSTSFVDMVVGTDTENLAANSECRMVYPEVNHSGCFFAEDGIQEVDRHAIQEVDRHADTLLHNSSTFRYPDNFTSSSCSMPPDMLANSFTQPLAFTTQLPTDASFMYSPNPNQISYLSQENTEEHMLPTAHDCFVYPKEAYSSPCEDKCNETKEPPKLVPANDFFIESLADSQCSSFKDRDTKTDDEDPGALCYEPPRFPSLDIPFFSCDLIQYGSDMQQEYSPLGIRQLMISSSMTPFKLWDSPSREDTTEAVLKSAAKTFTGTPSILKKRHRDLVSPLSERRYEKKLEGPSKQQSFSGLANDLSRLEKIFDECMDGKGPPLSLSPRKGNLEVFYEEKENVQPPCVHTGSEGSKSLVMSENNMSPKESKGECSDRKIADRNASVDLRNAMEMQAKDLAGILVEHDMSPSPRGLGHLSCRKNHVILSSSENSYFSIVCSPRVDKTRDGATSLIATSLQSSSRSGKKVESGCKGAASESNSTFMDTPFRRSIESPSAWKSPWFLNTFVPGPRVDTEITIEDIGYSVSPGDRSYDAIALMKQLGDQTASTFADAQEVLGDETPDTIMKEKCSAKINVEGADTSCSPNSQTTDNDLISPSNFKTERRTLDFSECVTPETKAGMFSNGKSSTSQSSHLLKSCR